jgi:hypothetical protein
LLRRIRTIDGNRSLVRKRQNVRVPVPGGERLNRAIGFWIIFRASLQRLDLFQRERL